MLNMLLSFGRSEGEDYISDNVLDPKDDTFRINLIVSLLDSVAEYIVSKKNKAFIDIYLISFQRYILAKSYVPMLLEFMILDLFDKIAPNLKKFKTFDEANQAHQRLVKVQFASSSA
jgi:regulator of nonsense transcripts 2